jgi:ribonuclease P protein component
VPAPSTTARSERLARHETLRRTSDYRSGYRDGSRRHGPLLTLHLRANELGHPRLGVTASRKVGGAVVRNRLKRWARETYRRWPARAGLGGFDLIVHYKPSAAEAAHAAVAGELERLLASAGRPRRA